MNASQSRIVTDSITISYSFIFFYVYIYKRVPSIYIFLTALPCFIMDVVILNSGINLFFFQKRFLLECAARKCIEALFCLLSHSTIFRIAQKYIYSTAIYRSQSCNTGFPALRRYKEYIQKKTFSLLTLSAAAISIVMVTECILRLFIIVNEECGT